tara:strand:+ start:375 stop:608 length:234 start_codon:yes stop_codon:yes gene_type:complete
VKNVVAYQFVCLGVSRVLNDGLDGRFGLAWLSVLLNEQTKADRAGGFFLPISHLLGLGVYCGIVERVSKSFVLFADA